MASLDHTHTLAALVFVPGSPYSTGEISMIHNSDGKWIWDSEELITFGYDSAIRPLAEVLHGCLQVLDDPYRTTTNLHDAVALRLGPQDGEYHYCRIWWVNGEPVQGEWQESDVLNQWAAEVAWITICHLEMITKYREPS